MANSRNLTIIEPKSGWQPIDWKELWRYKDLFYFLVWRDVKTRYAQSVLGIGWAVIQPIFSMIVFTIVFGKLAKINSDGVPYAIFSYTALVPWTYFSGALTGASGSLLGASGMMTKVYFPRLIIPMAPVMSKLIDFGIAFVILLLMMAYFGFMPSIQIIYLPLLILIMMITASGMGMWLTAMAVKYRDINYAMSFFVQLLMYAAPVVYPASIIPEPFRLIYGCFPMVGVIEGFRSILLKTNPMPWDLIGVGSIVACFLFISGAFYFRRMEKYFADVA
ncbi:MAG: ABC transporter permease [Candidatus Marinimicrobia bacterium]|nr:ABC transporter permease [Candidatus Neomarinimicrobiota bacterium]